MRIVSSVWAIVPLFLQSSFIVATNTAEVGLREEGYGNVEDFVVDVDIDADVDVDADVDADVDVDAGSIVTHEEGQEEEDYNDLRLLRPKKKKKNLKPTNKTSKNAKKNAKKTPKPTPSPTDSPTTNPTVSSQPTSLSDGALRFPPEINASDGRFSLTMELVDYNTVAANTLTTRLFDGIMPGPTIVVKPGDNLEITMKNLLTTQDGVNEEPHNVFGNPDTINLHYHGGHVSGEEPSDDVYIKIRPGDKYEYFTNFPENHMPGTHWIHPHVHGSSALQVGGGASMAMIIYDDPTLLLIPPEVASANDVLLVVQDFQETLNDIARDGGDQLFLLEKNEEVGGSFRLVNGQYLPTLTLIPGEWSRFRVIYAGWQVDETLDFKIESAGDGVSCETYLLAKDGIYIKDYPRSIELYPIPPGGRADIMVRCNTEGTFIVKHFDDVDLLTIESVLPAGLDTIIMAPGPTLGFAFNYPAYLTDVQDVEPDPGCSCSTELKVDLSLEEFSTINGRVFEVDEYIHTIKFGDVAERTLIGLSEHPYHQHVYPFQIASGYDNSVSSDEGYWAKGDWQDTIQSRNEDEITMKYRANVHLGKIMLHCHALVHEDFGMMTQERVLDDGDCSCNFTYDYEEK